MALKTFNLDPQVYEEFSKHCKQEGINMSKRIENFIREEITKLKSFNKIPNLKKSSKSTLVKKHSFSKYC